MASQNTPKAGESPVDSTASATKAPEPTDAVTTAPDVEDVKRPPLRDLESIKYTGSAQTDERHITVENLQAAGVETPEGLKDLVFNAENGFSVPVKDLNAKIVDFLLAHDGFDAV